MADSRMRNVSDDRSDARSVRFALFNSAVNALNLRQIGEAYFFSMVQDVSLTHLAFIKPLCCPSKAADFGRGQILDYMV